MRTIGSEGRTDSPRRPLALLLIAFSLGAAAIGLLAIVRERPRPPTTLEIDLRASAGVAAQLYWVGGQPGIADERSIRVPLKLSSELQRLRFALPRGRLTALRFDPTDAPADVWIRHARVLDADGRTVTTLNPASFIPAHQVASMKQEGDLTHIVVSPDGRDPFLMIPVDCLGGPAAWYSLASVTPVSLTLACLGLGALLVAGAGALARDVWSGPERRKVALWMTALFFSVFGAKLVLMRVHPLTTPFWDQWFAEAGALYIPFNEGCLPWSTMVGFHNEHRILFSRLLALGVLATNGEWDPRLQQVINAGLHALTAILVTAIFWLAADRRRLDLFALVCGLAVALPFGWENTINGFQSAFYLLFLFSVVALGLTSLSAAGSTRWLLGWAFAVAAVFTAASGLLAAVAMAAASIFRLMCAPRQWREPALNLIAAAVVSSIGLALMSPPLPHHTSLQPATFAAYMMALGRNLAWPWVDNARMALVMWTPFVGMFVVAALRRASHGNLERTAFGLGAWVLLQAGAVAYARGAQGSAPASRYMDFLSLGLLVNTAAFLALLCRAQAKPGVRRPGVAAFAVWLLVAVVGLDELTRGKLGELNGWQQYWVAHEVNVRQFVLADDVKDFTSRQPLREIPYPDPPMLANAWLRHPYVRSILPARVREPSHVAARAVTNDAFIRGGVYSRVPADPLRVAWGSFTNSGHAAVGKLESEPIPGCRKRDRLRFEVAGYLGRPGHYLAVREVSSGREWEVRPARAPGEAWIEAVVTCPSSAFVIVAEDRNPDSWFAFRAPVKTGRASGLAEWIIRESQKVLILGLALVVLSLRLA
jgi:hypothetical protein